MSAAPFIHLVRIVAAAALVILDPAALIISAYCNGILVDFHPPAVDNRTKFETSVRGE
jgi:hypothetical protein